MACENLENARWFADEVHPHEPRLRAWLSLRFPALRDMDDLVQETYLRLLRARSTGSIAHPKSFLFATARNAALDRVRRERSLTFEPLREEEESIDTRVETPVHADQQSRKDQLLAEAIRALPPRCREVLMLRKLHGLSHEEIAARLGVSKNTVNAHITSGMLRCRDHFRTHGLVGGLAHEIA